LKAPMVSPMTPENIEQSIFSKWKGTDKINDI
jgi:hypothetical protein